MRTERVNTGRPLLKQYLKDVLNMKNNLSGKPEGMANKSGEYVINVNNHWLYETFIILSSGGGKKARRDRSKTLENNNILPGMGVTGEEGSKTKV